MDAYSRAPQSLYAQVEYWLSKKLKLIGGLQWNKPENVDADLINRAGLVYRVNEQWGLKLLRGEAFRSASATENYINRAALQGNPDLNPEEVTTYDAQVFFQGQNSQFALTYFNSDIRKLNVRYQPAPGQPTTFRDGKGMDFQGIEFEGKMYMKKGLYALGSLTYQDSDVDTGISPSLVPHTLGKFGIGCDNENTTLGLFYLYYSQPPEISGAARLNPRPDAVHTVSLNLTHDVTQWMPMKSGSAKLNLRIENLLDEEVHFPEFGRRNLNSMQTDPGILFYADLDIRI